MKKLLVILAVIAMVGAFTATSIAAEWNFYGHSRFTTMRYNKSKEVAGIAFDDDDTAWNNQTNTRLGAKVKASDAVSGRFEFQTGQDVLLRLMYGVWNFGPGKLLVGQDYTPADTLISSSVGDLPSHILAKQTAPITDGGGSALQIGNMYTSRLQQIKLTFDGFQIAFIAPSTVGATGTYSDIDTTLPKIELGYTFKTDMFSIKPYAGYNSVDFSDPTTDNDVSIDSYIYGLQFGFNMGPAYIKGNVFGAQNSGNYGRSNITNFDTAVVTGVNIDDSDEYGGIILVGFKLNDMFKFEAGYAMDKASRTVAGIESENDPTHYYLNATITMAPGVFIVPEYGKFDFGDNDVAGSAPVDQGDVTYWGAKWQINF